MWTKPWRQCNGGKHDSGNRFPADLNMVAEWCVESSFIVLEIDHTLFQLQIGEHSTVSLQEDLKIAWNEVVAAKACATAGNDSVEVDKLHDKETWHCYVNVMTITVRWDEVVPQDGKHQAN